MADRQAANLITGTEAHAPPDNVETETKDKTPGGQLRDENQEASAAGQPLNGSKLRYARRPVWKREPHDLRRRPPLTRQPNIERRTAREETSVAKWPCCSHCGHPLASQPNDHGRPCAICEGKHPDLMKPVKKR